MEPSSWDWDEKFLAWGLTRRLEQQRWFTLFSELPSAVQHFRGGDVLVLSSDAALVARTAFVCRSADLAARSVSCSSPTLPRPGEEGARFDVVLLWDGWTCLGSLEETITAARAFSRAVLCIDGELDSAERVAQMSHELDQPRSQLTFLGDQRQPASRGFWVIAEPEPEPLHLVGSLDSPPLWCVVPEARACADVLAVDPVFVLTEEGALMPQRSPVHFSVSGSPRS